MHALLGVDHALALWADRAAAQDVSGGRHVEQQDFRLADQCTGEGKALLFNNIKDYNKADSRCRSLFACSLSSYRRIAMMLGLSPDTHPRDLVNICRSILTGTVAPKLVNSGPVKENIVKGKDVDLYELPAPHWNRADGGRYLITYAGCVTKHPTPA